jgi:shikimate kinase
MDTRLKRTPGIYLTGFMGTGKTTIGKMLADRLGWNFVDLDAEIEAAQHITIAELFEKRGEPEFRDIESAMLQKIVQRIERGAPSVVALGGGTYVGEENARLINEHGISVWLDCPVDILQSRLDETESRPLARDPERFRRLYEERGTAYARASYRVSSDCAWEQAVDAILHLACWK